MRYKVFSTQRYHRHSGMYVCMYACMHVCMYVYVLCVYLFSHTYIHTYIHTHIYTHTQGLGPPTFMFVVSAKSVNWMAFYSLTQTTINRGTEGQWKVSELLALALVVGVFFSIISVCVDAYIAYIHTYIHTYIHIYIHIYMHIYVYTYTYTQDSALLVR